MHLLYFYSPTDTHPQGQEKALSHGVWLQSRVSCMQSKPFALYIAPPYHGHTVSVSQR
jgi:hypothetical protein